MEDIYLEKFTSIFGNKKKKDEMYKVSYKDKDIKEFERKVRELEKAKDDNNYNKAISLLSDIFKIIAGVGFIYDIAGAHSVINDVLLWTAAYEIDYFHNSKRGKIKKLKYEINNAINSLEVSEKSLENPKNKKIVRKNIDKLEKLQSKLDRQLDKNDPFTKSESTIEEFESVFYESNDNRDNSGNASNMVSAVNISYNANDSTQRNAIYNAQKKIAKAQQSRQRQRDKMKKKGIENTTNEFTSIFYND